MSVSRKIHFNALPESLHRRWGHLGDMNPEYIGTMEVICTRCGPVNVTVWLIVDIADIAQPPELMYAIRDGTIHEVACPSCGVALGGVDAPLLLHCPGYQPPLVFSPPEATETEENQEAIEMLVEQWRRQQVGGGPTGPVSVIMVLRKLLPQLAESLLAALEQRVGVLPWCPDPIVPLVKSFVQSRSWNGSYRMLHQCSELLTEEAELTLVAARDRAWAVGYEAAAQGYEEHAALLRRCRELGIDEAFAEHLGSSAEGLWFEPDVPQLIWDLIEAAMRAEQHYLHTGNVEILDRALTLWTQALQKTPKDAPYRPRLLEYLGAGFRMRYARTGSIEDLHDAITLQWEALELTSKDSSHRPDLLSSLGDYLRMRYERTGQIENLRVAIALCEQAVEASSKNTTPRPGPFNNLGCTLCARYKWAGAMDDLDRAITLFKQAVAACSRNPQQRSAILSNLAAGLSERYNRTRQNDDHQEAVALYRQALASTTPTSSAWPGCLTGLGNRLMTEYEQTGRTEDLEEAIILFRQAAEATSDKLATLPGYLNNLSNGLSLRYERTDRIEDLEEAIAIQRQAVEATPTDSPDCPMFFDNLSDRLVTRYERTGRLEDIDEAIATQRQVLATTAPDTPKWIKYLSNLGDRLCTRYEWTGRLEDLEEAIAIQRQAVSATALDSPDLPAILDSLGNVLLAWHKRTARMEDLEEAISLFRLASDAASSAPGYLNRLGNSLWRKADLTGRIRDKQDAISVFRRALERISEDFRNRASILINLGGCLASLPAHTRRQEDLEEAITVLRQAVEATPKGSRDWPGVLTNLSTCLRTRHEHMDRAEDLEEAIALSRRAVEVSSKDSTDLSTFLTNLGIALHRRYERHGRVDDLREAVALFRQAIDHGRVFHPEHGLMAACAWANRALERSAWQEASSAYDEAMVIADALYEEQFLRSGKHGALREVQTVYARAAYCRARLGDLAGAVLALENGRARVLTDTLERSRADLEQAEKQAPEIVKCYREALAQLNWLEAIDAGGGSPQISGKYPQSPEQIRHARVQLHKAVETIRSIPGYEMFLAKLSWETFAAALVPEVPVVYLAATPVGGIALLVSNKDEQLQVTPLWLDALTQDTLLAMFNGSKEDPAVIGWLRAHALWMERPDDQQARVRWHETIAQTTRALWDLAMGPVVALLRERCTASEQVVLIPDGLLALLPLHAAWTQDNTGGPCWAIDDFAFCYAPSLRTLTHARDIVGRCGRTKLLTVDEPQPTSGSPLPNSRHEVDAAAMHFGRNDATRLAGEQCSRNNVLAAIASADVCHFSCHGTNNWLAPLRSGLLMANDELLTVADLLTQPNRQARLAVLSACESGVVGTDTPNEVLALPAAFVQAGFAGVVASLWSVYDISTSLLMERFYELWCKEQLVPTVALQRAQIWLRELTSRELIARLEELVPELVPRMPLESAAALHFRALVGDPDARPFGSPVHWAAFYLTGV